MIKKLLFVIVLLLTFSIPSMAQYTSYQNWVQQGGQTVTTSGLISTTFVQRSFKTGTITITDTATGNTSTIYSNATGTPLANPFTNQNILTGQFFFFAAPGTYNIQIAATGLTTYTIGSVTLGGGIWTRTSGGLIYPLVTSDHVAINTSADNGFNLDDQGTLNVLGVSTFSGGKFTINALGNITKINNVTTSWPGTQGGAGTVLTNDGSGNFSWGTGGGGGSGITCTGCTTNVLVKYNGTNGADSTIFDNGTTTTIGTLAGADNATIRLEVEKDSNAANSILMRNNTSGTAAIAAITARSGSASNDFTLEVTSAGFTPGSGLVASSGVLYSGANATGGITLQSAAGDIRLQPAGTTTVLDLAAGGATLVGTLTANSLTYTFPASQAVGTYLKTDGAGGLTWSVVAATGATGLGGSGTTGFVSEWTAGTSLGNSSIFDATTNTTIGYGGAAPNTTRDRLYAEKDQNEATYAMIVNATSGTLGQAAFIAVASSNNQTFLGATSAGFSTLNGIASGWGYLSAVTTNGLDIQSLTGGTHIKNLIASSTVLDIAAAGITVTGTTTFNTLAYTWPASQSANYFLQTNGSGTLSWVASAGGIGGSGTTNFVPVFTAAATQGNSTIFDDGTSTTVGYGGAPPIPATQRLYVEKDQNQATYVADVNATSGTLGQAAFVAISAGGASTYMGSTSTAFITASGIPALAGYLSTTGSAGLYVTDTANAPIIFQTNLTERARFTGTQLLFGGASTDVTGTNIVTVGNTTGFVAAGATTNASVLSMSVVNGSYTSIASNRTGSGTYLPLAFFQSGTKIMQLEASPLGIVTMPVSGGGFQWVDTNSTAIAGTGTQIQFYSPANYAGPATRTEVAYFDGSGISGDASGFFINLQNGTFKQVYETANPNTCQAGYRCLMVAN